MPESAPDSSSLAHIRDAMSVRIDGEESGEVPERSRGARRIPRGPRPEAVPALIARACMLVGFLDIAAGVFPRFRHSRMHRMAEVLPGSLGPFAAALSLSAGVLLLLLAHGLRRRKRRAWRAAVMLLPAGAVAEYVYRHSVIGVVISVALLLPLLRHRSEFAALPDPRSRWRALANFVLMGAGSLSLGLIIVSVHPHRLVGDPSVSDRIEHVLYGMVGFEGPVDYTGNTSWTVGFSLGCPRPADRGSRRSIWALRPETFRAGAADRRRRGTAARPTGQARRPRLARPLRAPPRQGRRLLAERQGGGDLPRRVWRDAGQWRPDRRCRGLAGRHRAVHGRGQAHSWTPAVMGCSETGGEVWTRRDRPGRPRTG